VGKRAEQRALRRYAVGRADHRERRTHRPPRPSACLRETNLGALVIHKNRVWTFVTQDNADTLNQPQIQLWYSNVDRPWEFDDTSQVLLMQSDVAVPPSGGVYQYNGLYGNEPRGLGKTGTVLVAFTIRETWAVYGDDQSTFVQRELFNIGCTSRHSITMAGGGSSGFPSRARTSSPEPRPRNTGERLRDQIRPLARSAGVRVNRHPGFRAGTGRRLLRKPDVVPVLPNAQSDVRVPHHVSRMARGASVCATTTAGIATLASAARAVRRR